MSVCRDLSAADWIEGSELPWQRLVSLGPAGFAAYARLRFVPDPTHPGQSESDWDLGPDAPSETEQMRAAALVLAESTSAELGCFFAVWHGWGTLSAGTAAGLDVPRTVRVPHREYFLLQGEVADLGAWDDTLRTPARSSSRTGPVPSFTWPADRAWCITRDVDPHYAGIGASAAAIAELLEQPLLDVVRVDPAEDPPAYL